MRDQILVILDKNREIQIRREAIKAPNEDQILCRTLKSLISPGTELGKVHGRFYWSNVPSMLGYSNVAVIEEVGAQVEDFQKQQRVYSQAPHTSRFLIDKPSISRLVPCSLSDSIMDEDATFVTLAAVGWHALHRMEPMKGEPLMIVGDGLVGLLIAFLSSYIGYSQIFMLGHHRGRMAKAEAVGVETVTKEHIRRLSRLYGTFPIVINTAGSVASICEAIPLCSDRGSIVQVGSIAEALPVSLWELQRREIAILPAFQPLEERDKQLEVRRQMIELIATKQLPVGELITHRFPIDQAVEAYKKLEADRDSTLGVIITYEC